MSNYLTHSIRVSSFAVVLLLTACGGEEGPQATDERATTSTVTAPNTTPVQLAPSAPNTAVLDPNPPHGQPGHRCEIAVGASLSSAPAVGATGISPSNPVINTAPISGAPATAPGPTPPGMNPPHGQPGHDCNVAVGSPLPK
ncbi:MAG: hypothetical protein IPG10_06845 [Flavobacteriales bacterium]|nr:hypothetical protein [Flavobacteriales bacterium]MBK6752597.1 hypothetical protein [Flavobacteriales bacterium]MBK7268519.1 hypothetical protein [Flavobacteriales bacterium]MBK7753034.1 hypothetical protein [Flavobacteriales bacterium]MBK9076061.1 hypothetical protein [Flavobacteriales bacterium]